MSKLQDEYDMGRIPLRPLLYENRDKAYTQELIVDSHRSNPDETPSYHIYISDSTDRSILYDLTDLLLQSAFSGKDIYINIDGVENPISLYELMNFLYRRFIHINNPDGFNPDADKDKLKLPTNKIAFLQDINNEFIYPITTTDAIYDSDGNTLESRLSNMSRIAFIYDKIVIEENKYIYSILYPFSNYFSSGNGMFLYYNGKMISRSNYNILESEGNTFSIEFKGIEFNNGDIIDIVYIYNSSTIDGSTYKSIDGHSISNRSININKLETVSDSYTVDDSESIATSRAVYRLYDIMCEMMMNKNKNAIYCKDLATFSSSMITINLSNDKVILDGHYLLVHILTQSSKNKNIKLSVVSLSDEINREPITTIYNIDLQEKVSANRIIRCVINASEAIVLDSHNIKIENSRYIHYCDSEQTIIPFKGLTYYEDSIIHIYRNGVRLFKDLDYLINFSTETITLFTKTQPKEKIIFESQYLSF